MVAFVIDEKTWNGWKSFSLLGLVMLLIFGSFATASDSIEMESSSLTEWIVTGSETYQNQGITLRGNLIVKAAGSLTLDGVKLSFDPIGDSPIGITVEPEGSLVIRDSAITSESAAGFRFLVGQPFKWPKPKSAALTVERCTLQGVSGVSLNGVDNARIETSTILIRRQPGNSYGIDLSGSKYCALKNNRIGVYPPVASPPENLPLAGILGRRAHYNMITGNVISDTRNGINLAFSWNNRIENNIWTGPIAEPGLKTLTEKWWSVSTSSQAGEAGLFLGPWSNNNTVEGNSFSLSNTGIIVILQSQYNKVRFNTVRGGGIAVALIWVSDCLVEGNIFYDIYREEAIHAFASRHITIINNEISEAAGGVGLYSSTQNHVEGNRISVCGRGVFLHDSSLNEVVGNGIWETPIPAVLTGSSDNVVRSNNFVQEGLHSYDGGERNVWQGNFWGLGVSAPYHIPPSGVDPAPSEDRIPVRNASSPTMTFPPFEEPPYEDRILEKRLVLENQAVSWDTGLVIRNGGELVLRDVTLDFSQEVLTSSLEIVNPVSILVTDGGSLFVEDSRITGPEWGSVGGLQIVATGDSRLTIRGTEIRNAGIWTGDGAVAIDPGAQGALVENNRFERCYCAVSMEGSENAIVRNNVVTNAVFGINAIGDGHHAVVGNDISMIGWKGISVENPTTIVEGNRISGSWGVGILPSHWGSLPQNNTYADIMGPSVLFQSPTILTGQQGLRAFSLSPSEVEPGRKIAVHMRIAHTTPHYGIPDNPAFPERIEDTAFLPFAARLRVGDERLDSEYSVIALGDAGILKLEGVPGVTGTYNVLAEPWECAVYEAATGILRIPSFELGGGFYWIALQLSVAGDHALNFVLDGAGLSGFTARPSSFHLPSEVLFVPCLDLDGGPTYWLEMQLLSGEPITLELVSYGVN